MRVLSTTAGTILEHDPPHDEASFEGPVADLVALLTETKNRLVTAPASHDAVDMEFVAAVLGLELLTREDEERMMMTHSAVIDNAADICIVNDPKLLYQVRKTSRTVRTAAAPVSATLAGLLRLQVVMADGSLAELPPLEAFYMPHVPFTVIPLSWLKEHAHIDSCVDHIQLVRCGVSQRYQHVSAQNIGTVLENKYFFKYVGGEDVDDGDSEQRTCWNTTSCDALSDGLFNLWSGLDACRMPAVPEEEAQRLFDLYAQHCIDVLGRDEANFLLDLFAHIVQKPHVKTGVAVLITGPHGSGKGTIADIFRAVVGPTHAFRVGAKDVKERLFGRFSDGLKMKVMVQVDEAPDLTKIILYILYSEVRMSQ
eukprot:CAMPEP_0169438610 /NCGR_PEP_ID=MMETSP1042-20121227/6770_1 /TAXON_ID=464988 /ORGANISM="Hemiselmis andersenii, Strain CCMP1180" /LENGTH=367 /DNA_ID=CAMNT_0009549495 /DNA_START=362 /DNA_END=1465 /DNA_ORIENTATION=+